PAAHAGGGAGGAVGGQTIAMVLVWFLAHVRAAREPWARGWGGGGGRGGGGAPPRRAPETRKALEPGLEALLATLGGDDSDVQTDVLERLKEVRLQPEAIVASLLKLLEKPGGGASMEVRGEVFDVLVELAQDARSNPGALDALKEAEPVMTAVLGDQDAEVRAGAARVLAAIGAAKAKAETPK
ncbi:MAG: hypothetical protein P4L85_09655, partial [Paludisphaera borealis]